jgi:PAS domain S-box-containing protein
VLFNNAAEKMFGCTQDEALGTAIDRFIPERFRPEHEAYMRRFGESGVTTRNMGTPAALWAVRVNGQEFPMEASITHLESDGRKLFTVIIRDITERKLAEESLATIGRRLIEAHEQERTWIGRELHDDINQRLALLAVELDQWCQHIPPNDEFIAQTRRAQERISQIAKDVQGLSHRLHSSKLEYLGLAKAANSFCKELSEHTKVEIQFNHSGIPRTLSKEVSLCLFRVLQEALQNAVKHSGVRSFTVDLRGTEELIDLTVADLGAGFEEQDAFTGHGLGLISMRERLQLVHGELSVKSKPGAGTTIRARAPLRVAEYRAMAG